MGKSASKEMLIERQDYRKSLSENILNAIPLTSYNDSITMIFSSLGLPV